MSRPSFSVCVLARETPDVIDRFVSHYLGLGAEVVRVFFDGEPDEAAIPERPGMELVVCSKTFWDEQLGRRPFDLDEALRTVFRLSHDTAPCDWQIFVDADEFLVSDVPLAEVLASVQTEYDGIRILNCEAVWGPGDKAGAPFACTHFRTILGPRMERLSRLFMPRRMRDLMRRGFVGHSGGKHILRAGARVDAFDSHFSVRRGREVGVWAHEIGYGTNMLFLAHFDAVSEARWAEKWRRRISEERPSTTMAPHRQAQFDAVAKAAGSSQLHQLFRDMYCLSRSQAIFLTAIRGLQRRQIFPPQRSISLTDPVTQGRAAPEH